MYAQPYMWLESFYVYNNPTKKVRNLGMLTHACKANTRDPEAGGLGILSLPELCSETASQQNKINKYRFTGLSVIPMLRGWRQVH